jgi:peptide/nickel transport system substrate-binding protein
VRRALNFALDRAWIVRRGNLLGLGRPTCQVLPPNMLGYRPYCPYTADHNASGVWTAPDLSRARRLVAASGTRAARITVWADPSGGGIRDARYVTALLDRLGYRARFRVKRTDAAYFTYVDNSANKAQIGPWGWGQDYPNPIDFFAPTLTCASFLPSNPNNLNVAEFCDREISKQIAAAAALQQSNPIEAAHLWAQVDRKGR